MKRVIDTSEVLGSMTTPDGDREVCVTADAGYDEGAGRVVVRLDAFLRGTGLRTKETRFSAEWLPKPETIRELASPDEAVDLARDVFHRWVRKVRGASPKLANR